MIQSFLRPAALAAILLSAAVLTARADAASLLDTLRERGDAGAFLAAAARTDLADALSGPGPFTLFVPTDAAFAALPEATLDRLERPDNRDRLTGLLSYHVVPGEIRTADLEHGQPLATVDGIDLSVAVSPDAVGIGGASLVAPDIAAANGVIHMIDRVLAPPGG